jgi:F5/8 type C domain
MGARNHEPVVNHDTMDFSTLFTDPAAWQVFASGQARGLLSPIVSPDGKPGVRLDYDFHGGGGFVVMRRVIALRLPDTFEIGFRLRGEGPPNHFEFKVASPGGANVWRHLRQDYKVPAEWSDFRFHERGFPFAWGPAGGGAPSEVEAVEIVIAAGPGGKGSVELSDASLADQTLRAPHAVHASGYLTGHPPQAAFDPSPSGWRAAPDDANPWWSVDFGRSLRFGGLVIHWPEDLPPRTCAVEVSNDGENWTILHRMTRALGNKSHIAAHGAEARYLRVTFANAACAAIRRIELRPDAFSSTPNEFIHSVAADYPRGWHPRYWHREQSYWTPVGSPDGRRRALINEEGMVEVDEGGFSLEPFILTKSGVISWAEVKTTSAMAKHGVPMPSVAWETRDLRLEILPWVDGRRDELALRVTYRLRATLPHDSMRLALAVRPFQVNPPWQAFRNLGGRSPITRVIHEPDGMQVNDRLVFSSPPPDSVGAAMFEEGGVLGFLTRGVMPSMQSVEDATGLASAAMLWELPAGVRSLAVTVSVPYYKSHGVPSRDGRSKALARWRRKLGAVEWHVPDCAKPAFDCLLSAAGHILINRDSAAIQPGPRRYTRSWVRDCVIMGAALVKAGLPHALDEFIRWYAPFQREDGFVPCVVDRDGVDWLVEHDSHGQFLWGIREVFRARQDPRFLTKLFPHARKAADYLIELRAQRMTEEFRSGERSAGFGLLPESMSLEDEDTLDARSEFFGLLPESASHEGYLAHPVHSYWDDFWGVRGLEAAADLAEAAGLPDDAERWRKEAGYFQDDLLWSLRKVIKEKNLNYIPGSVEWADFDPTATSNAIAMLDFADVLPAAPLHAMLETYLDGHRRKHRGEMQWNNYTAYEIRIIGAFVRLGKRDIANELLEFHLADRRPRAWNQWPEITWRDPRSPGHLGDVPHTWIAAEYILALTSMVASEREASSSLVLASGMPWQWISEPGGFAVRNLPTRFGPLDFRIHATSDDVIHMEVADTIVMPPGGLRVIPPLPEGKRMCPVNPVGGPCVVTGNEIHIHALPCVLDVPTSRIELV